MFGLGLPELLLILVIGLISALGKSMKEFKQAVNSTEAEIKNAGEITEPAKEETAQAEAKK